MTHSVKVLSCFSTIAAIGCALLTSCGLPVALPEQYRYNGDLTSEELAGVWVVDAPSVGRLATRGVTQYVRRSDHVVLLNANGSFVERGPDTWFFSGDSNEDQSIHQGLVSGTRPDNPEQTAFMRYYIWNPRAESVISGPLEQSDVDGNAIAIRSKADTWRLRDRGTDGINLDEREMIRTRYAIQLVERSDSSQYSGKELFVGKDDQEIFVWRFVPGSHSCDVPDDVLVYRRMSMEDLRRLVQKGE